MGGFKENGKIKSYQNLLGYVYEPRGETKTISHRLGTPTARLLTAKPKGTLRMTGSSRWRVALIWYIRVDHVILTVPTTLFHL